MATSHTIGSRSSVAREDIYLSNIDAMQAAVDGPDGLYTILRSASKLQKSGTGKFTMNFPSSDTIRQDGALPNLGKVDGARYRVKQPGTAYERNGDMILRGMNVPISWGNPEVAGSLRDGSMSPDDFRTQKFMESWDHLVEDIELLGTERASNGLGDATTPFVIPDTDASGSYGYWDADTSNPIKEIMARKNALKEYGVVANTGYMSWTVGLHLANHPRMTSLFGGNTGFGALQNGDLARALGLTQLYFGNPDRYGEYVTICAQGAPGNMYLAGSPNLNTVIYVYDPMMGDEPYGAAMYQEAVPGTAGDDEWCITRARCEVILNPLSACRISNVLT